MWPFGKKNKDNEELPADAAVTGDDAVADYDAPAPADGAGAPGDFVSAPADSAAVEAETGAAGPFDADEAKPEDFDFSDFAKASLNLGSVLLTIPREGDIQVEMGPQGPTMLHVATPFGRITPVAFAAPTSGGQWAQSAEEIRDGLANDGLDVTVEQGPWGAEVVGERGDMAMRIMGADGPRWMMRLTLAGPKGQSEDLARLGRGVMARSFVTRGDNPMPAGQPLPVTLPAAMAEQVRKAYEQSRQGQQNQQGQQAPGAGA